MASTNLIPTTYGPARTRIAGWFFWFTFWRLVHYVLLLIITTGSIVVAVNNPKIISADFRDVLAVIVAVCSGLYAAFQPSSQAKAYREAWILLEEACRNSDAPDVLSQAITDGERTIEKLAPRPEPKPQEPRV